MAELRGRPYAFIVLTVAVWIGARITWPGSYGAIDHPLPLPKALDPASTLPVIVATSKVSNAPKRAASIQPRPVRKSYSHSHGLPPALVPWQVGSRPSGLPMPLRVAGDGKSLSAGRDTPPTIAHAPVGKAGPPELLRQKRWQLYAYSFWRASGSNGNTLGPNAQYGGSQSGIIATVDPFGAPDRGIALLMRGSTTPEGTFKEARELALGVRWKPVQSWPLTLSAERRFLERRADDFAAYLAGGFDRVPLIKGWKLGAFGQAGYATGQGGGSFFDVQTRAMHRLSEIGKAPISAGVGSWAGGQKGAFRVDVGPTIAAKIDANPAIILVQLDWRLRVAGDAAPKNGLALTVSSGF